MWLLSPQWYLQLVGLLPEASVDMDSIWSLVNRTALRPCSSWHWDKIKH